MLISVCDSIKLSFSIMIIVDQLSIVEKIEWNGKQIVQWVLSWLKTGDSISFDRCDVHSCPEKHTISDPQNVGDKITWVEKCHIL